MKWASTVVKTCPGKLKYLLLILILPKNKCLPNRKQSMVLALNWDQIEDITCYTPKASKLYVEKGHLTSLKVSYLSYKSVFYRSEHNENGGSHEFSFDDL